MNAQSVELVVCDTHPALAGHFPHDPIVPAAWLLTLVAQACRESLGVTKLAGLRSARFRAPLRPDIAFVIEVEHQGEASIRFRLLAADVRIADGVIEVGA